MRSRGLVVAGIVAALALPLPAAAADVSSRTVYVADLTFGPWPVAAAAANWNRNGRVTLVQVPACTPDMVQCVEIVEAQVADPAQPWAPAVTRFLTTGEGCTEWTPDCTTRWQVVLSLKWVRSSWSRTVIRQDGWSAYRLRRLLLCHELGHVLLGPGHPATGCMSLLGRWYAGPVLLERLRAGVPAV